MNSLLRSVFQAQQKIMAMTIDSVCVFYLRSSEFIQITLGRSIAVKGNTVFQAQRSGI